MPSIEFLQHLSRKLKIGNLRSIHLNALPGRFSTRLDLGKLDLVSQNLAAEFLNTLLTEPAFSFSISYDNINLNIISEEQQGELNFIAKKLNGIHYQNNDNYLEHGIKTFGFGYPFLIKRDKNDPSKIIKAPILIWHLDIIKSTRKTNEWIIKRDEDYPISINEVLISHIEQDESISIEKLDQQYLQDFLIDQTEVLEITKQILQQLNVKEGHNKQSLTINKCPSKEYIENMASNIPWVSWSGVFGLFRAQKESIISDIESLIENYDSFDFEDFITESYQTSTISSIETDPSQEGIINSLTKHRARIVQGPPGTGKSQSLTAILLNTLENGGTCLVVCEKKTAMDVLFNNLKKIGIEDLCAIVDDVSKDRKKIVNSVRTTIEFFREFFTDYWEDDYNYELNRYNELKQEIINRHKSVFKKVFGDHNWKSMIGKYLKNKKISPDTDLKDLLQASQYKFEFAEFQHLYQIVRDGQFLFEKIGTLRHPLSILNDHIFENQYLFLQKQAVESKITKLKIKTEQLLEKLNELESPHYSMNAQLNEIVINSIKQNNTTTIVDALKGQLIQSHELIGDIDDSIEKYDGLFDNNKFPIQFKLGIYSLISSHYSAIRKHKRDLKSKVSQFIESHFESIGTDFDFIEPIKKFYFSQTLVDLKKYETLLASSFIPEIDRIVDINSTYELLRTTLIKYNILDHNFPEMSENNDYSAVETSVRILYNKLLEVLDNVGEFQNFHEWRNYYLRLEIDEQKLIIALIDSKVEDWLPVYECWYYDNILGKFEAELSPFHNSNKLIEDFIISRDSLQKMQIAKIKNIWIDRQRNHISRYRTEKGNINSLYNLRKNKQYSRRNSLRRIIKVDFELFTSFSPILMVNPVVASSILPMEEGLFDIVIFDEASQLRLEDTYTSLVRGKFQIISGDVHQMPPSNYFGKELVIDSEEEIDDEDEIIDDSIEMADKESLLQFGVDSAYEMSFLDFHYRSRHPYLIDFSNSAFYGSRLTPMPEKNIYTPIKHIQVNGLYNNRSNMEEARVVIDLLFNYIPIDKNGKYPSVGIATFNMEQRNKILELIQDECYMDINKTAKFEQLRNSGLFVKNLENIQGDERDIIILSTTFGLNADGKFRQSFGPINQAKGYKLLNVIITRAKHRLFVCTSIPELFINSYPDEIKVRGNVGKGVFYAYLAYTKSIQEENNDLRLSILQLLQENCIEASRPEPNKLVESPFEQEVYDYLTDYFDKDQIIPQYSLGGFRIDFVILDKNKKPLVAVECDGARYHSSDEAYSHDTYRQKIIEREMGIEFYRIWSTNWWRDTHNELNTLLNFIKKAEPKPVAIETEMVFAEGKEISQLLSTEDKEKSAFKDEEVAEVEYEIQGSLFDFNYDDLAKTEKIDIPKVQLNSLTTIKEINSGSKMVIKLTQNKEKVDLKNSNIKVVYHKSPLGISILNKTKGDKFKIGGIEVYYEIIEIKN